jgi:pimeloyl-ACP methyl ester carboxylesterase
VTLEYKSITINNVNVAYREYGQGRPVLFVHGFASSSHTWLSLIKLLPAGPRYVALDLKGYGQSGKPQDKKYSAYDQARLLTAFINELKLDNPVLVGHSFGGITSLLTLLMNRVKKPASGLILINSVAYFKHVPDFIKALGLPLGSILAPAIPVPRLLVRQVLGEVFYDSSKITDELIDTYTENLRSSEAKKSLAVSASQFVSKDLKLVHKKFNQIHIPVLILSGADDRVIPVEESYALKRDIPQAELKTIPMCGHSPQEECPEETAEFISGFLQRPQAILQRFSFAHILERLKDWGLLPKIDGWRTATQTYLRTEHTKFTLAAFRLNLWSDAPFKTYRNAASAKEHIIERLALFLKSHPLTYSQLLWGKFSTQGMKKKPVDIVCADFNDNGTLKGIQPYLDQSAPPFKYIHEDIAKRLDNLMIDTYNQLIHIKDSQRPRRLKAELKKRALARTTGAKKEIEESFSYLERILNSTFVHFEILPPEAAHLGLHRFKYPDFLRRKHPGFGVLNIRCRLAPDFSEADLWFQISHVAIDGVPMQNILNSLKAEWKTTGDLVFPSTAHNLAEVAPVQCTTESGKNARYYADQIIDFRPLLKVREELNKFYTGKLEAPITVISMLGWGLAHHPVFSGRKFLFPVDLPSVSQDERTLGFVSIRPSRFINNPRYQDTFLAYQKEFNRKLSRVFTRISGVYKLFEMFALMPPIVYWFMQKFMKHLFSKLLGSVVITMIKDADFFISPFSDVMLDGFIAIGNYSIPTEDHAMAGLVSAKSTKDKVAQYLSAVEQVVSDFNSVSGTSFK